MMDAMAAHGTATGSTIGGQGQGDDAPGLSAPGPFGGVTPASGPVAQAAQALKTSQGPPLENFQGYAPYDPAALMRLWQQRQAPRGFLG